MPSRRDMSRSDKTKRPRMRLSPSDKSALQSAYALIGPDAAREAQKSKTVLLFGDEVKGFNYESLPSDVANEARKIASELREAADKYHYRAGQQLTAIRPKFEHGQWEVWVELEVGFSPQVSRNYMWYYGFAQEFGIDIARLFRPSVVYRLASAPDPIKLLLIQRAKAGERISILDVQQAERSAHQPPRPALNDRGDDRGKEAPERSGDDIEGGHHAGTDEQLDEETNPSVDRLHGVAVDFADKLVAVLSDHPKCCWFQKQAHALISEPLRCQEVMAQVDEGLAVHQRRKPGAADT